MAEQALCVFVDQCKFLAGLKLDPAANVTSYAAAIMAHTCQGSHF